nr:ribosome small subunit-dependent GTPase A [bacterium]
PDAQQSHLAWIESILPRKNEFVRPPMANMDQAILIFAVCDPKPDPLLLDRMLVQALASEAGIMLCFNKIDRLEPGDDMADRLMAAYGAFSPLLVSARRGDGLARMLEGMEGKVSFVSGPSGAGKSSLLNAAADFTLETGVTSARIGRGKNTTRHTQLLPVGGGWVADTPGFSLLESPMMPPDRLQYLYPEFAPYLGACRFDNCLHDAEPGCAVAQAVAQGQVPRGRWRRYRTLLEELRQKWRNQYD